MLDYGQVRTVLKNVDKLDAKNTIIAEWNMNKYQKIDAYGVYVSQAPHNSSYVSDDPNIIIGQNYIIYADNSSSPSPEQEYLSEVSSIFRPNQPDPGIILMQKHKDTLMVKNSNTLKINNVNPSNPRYYPFTEFRKYDYFNSAKSMKKKSGEIFNGISNPLTGAIVGASPFVVYEDNNVFPCNKITIKVQNHLSVPKKFSIEVLIGTTWTPAYTVNQSSAADFTDGILNIYYTGSGWAKVANNTLISPYLVTNLEELSSNTPTQLLNIRGVRLSVYEMSPLSVNGVLYPAGLEILELSPRLEADISEYTEAFNFNSTLSDSTSFGLPVGAVVSSAGNIILSNENNQFLFSSKLSSLKMLSPDVKMSFFQEVDTSPTTSTFIPLKTLYATQWSVQEDYSVSVSLEDGFKFLRETQAFDILVRSSIGIKLSSAIMFLLDNSGLNGFNFVKSSNTVLGEDTIIRNFFCRREQTVAEVLQELAIATQCSMYFNAQDKLTILTKERLSKKVSQQESTQNTEGTDFWMIFDEDYSLNGGSVSEYSYIQGYNANVVSYNEEKINPITDGDITYHIYGPRKQPGLDSITENNLKKIIEDTVFPSSLAYANFQYNTQIVWQPGQDNDAALGAANLIKDLPETRLKDIFTGTYSAVNEDSAVRLIYNSATEQQKSNLIIYVDKNEGLYFGPYKGYVFIDNESIRYNGKLFHVNGVPILIFNDEEFNQKIRDLPKGSSISFIGLIIDIEFENIGENGSQYNYKVINDGRAKFGSSAAYHYAFVVGGNTGIEDSKKYSIQLGGQQLAQKPSTVIEYNFLERGKYKAVYKALKESNLLGKFESKSYLGFLKLQGIRDTFEYDKIDKAKDANQLFKQLKEINQQTDKLIDGNFDPYVYLNSESKIYAQRIDLPVVDNQPFIPNIVSTRMRLYSPRRSGKNEYRIAETLSSIAGIGININPDTGEGYYLEVEGAGSGKENIANKAYKNNLRFYKVFKNSSGKYEPFLIFSNAVAAFQVSNIDVQVVKPDSSADPVFELTVIIKKQKDNSLKFIVRYGDTKVGSCVDNNPINGNSISLFVRGDSQAIYEYISAGVREIKMSEESFIKRFNTVDEKIKTGIIPLSQQFLYKNSMIKYYYNDFAKLVREIKDYDIRFSFPTFASALIDVSSINNDYMIKSYRPTAFGAKLVVANTAAGPVIMTPDSKLPLYITGVVLEELSTGSVKMDDVYDKIDEKRKKIISQEINKSIYGNQTFSLDSQYIQSLNQSRNLMQWITKNCSRQRLKLSMEIFPNPILELGDKVKVYDKTRGYNEDNDLFGEKTFTVSSISYSVSNSGPSMLVDLIEVGAS